MISFRSGAGGGGGGPLGPRGGACAARRCGAGRSDDGIERWEVGAGDPGSNLPVFVSFPVHIFIGLWFWVFIDLFRRFVRLV